MTTPEGRAVITGTLVSVFRNSDLTCACLLKGSARFKTPDEDLVAIPLLKRWVVYADGRPCVILAVLRLPVCGQRASLDSYVHGPAVVRCGDGGAGDLFAPLCFIGGRS